MVTFTEFSAQYAPNGQAKIVYVPDSEAPFMGMTLGPGMGRAMRCCKTFKEAAQFVNEIAGADFDPEEEVRHV